MEKTILMGLMIAALTITSGMVVPSAIPVLAQDEAREGLDRADENVHDNTGLGSDQDDRFHEGLCQGGHSTTVLDNEAEGCDSEFISDPGNSDENRQDDNDDDEDDEDDDDDDE
jgi:hypothetical protein